MYFLVRDISQELEEFILTGKKHSDELHVFSEEREREMIKVWRQLGLKVAYHYQQIEYMRCNVMITYLRVFNPATDINISLIPWFMLPPNRPYPIFVYVYSIWYYHITGKKSLSQSAAAAGKLFGIDSLNKSTVCRSIKSLEGFIDISRIDRPLSVDEREIPPDEDMISSIPEILRGGVSIRALEETYGDRAKHLPAPIPRKETVSSIFCSIPNEYSRVIKDNPPTCGKIHDERIRPSRPRRKDLKHVQRWTNFTDTVQIRKIRAGFIKICRCIVLDAAIEYHRFLI